MRIKSVYPIYGIDRSFTECDGHSDAVESWGTESDAHSDAVESWGTECDAHSDAVESWRTESDAHSDIAVGMATTDLQIIYPIIFH